MTDESDPTIEKLETRLNEIKLRLSELRKKGKDTKIAELKIMTIPFKIRLADVTKSPKDIERVKSFFDDVEYELNSIDEVEVESTVKKEDTDGKDVKEDIKKENTGKAPVPEVESTPKIDNNLNSINILINKIDKSIKDNKFSEAKKHYPESYELYKKLNKEDKKKVYNKLMTLRTELVKKR